MTNPRGHGRQRSRGQALIEMAFVVVLLFLLATGIIEFGRAFMIANMVTHAVRDGGRFAATLPTQGDGGTYRNANGTFTGAGETAVEDHVRNLIDTVLANTGQLDDVIVQQTCENSVPIVTVQVLGEVNYVILVGLVGESFDVTRTMTFRDESGAYCA